MSTPGIMDLTDLVTHGRLFIPPSDNTRVEAFIPTRFPANHASQLAEAHNGDLLCVWFAGTEEGNSDVKIALSRLPAGGDRWTEPVLISDDYTRSEQNPMLFVAPDGRVWCFWTAQETRPGRRADWDKLVASGQATGSFNKQWTSIVRRRISEDNGHTWGPIEVAFGKPGSFIRQRIVVMSNGDWIFPFYYSLEAGGWHGDDYTVMQISSDQGKTWTEYPVPNSRGRVHAAVIELSPGRLIAFFRSRAADRIYVSRSTDYGRTWSEPVRTVLPNNNASIGAIKLASGPLAIIFNNCNAQEEDPNKTIWPRERYPVTIALSEDEGNTWPYMRNLDAGDGFVGEANKKLNRRLEYPMIFQSRDGLIHCTYSLGQRQCIKYVRITEAWIRDQVAQYVQNPGDDLGPAQPQ